MELVKRYIYAVTHKLPEAQRADIEKELHGLIEDMLEERVQGGEPTVKDVEEVLLELGHPRKLADQYRGYKQYLISPALFPTYMSILKIVLFAIGIAMTAVFGIETFMDPANVLDHFVGNLVSFINACFQGFTWVTVVFGFIDYAGVRKEKLGIKEDAAWKPSELPPLPDSRTRISRADPIASIIFTILFTVLFTFSIGLLGVWRFPGGDSSIVVPFFNEEVFRTFLPFIWAMVAVSVLQNCVKIIMGRWTTKLIAADIVIHLLHFALALAMFSDASIWNPNFLEQLAGSGLAPIGSEAYELASSIWNRSTESLLYLIGIVVAAEVIASVVKGYKIKDVC
jgi:ABC-type multidrug transport system fused ATPase/permease subunit